MTILSGIVWVCLELGPWMYDSLPLEDHDVENRDRCDLGGRAFWSRYWQLRQLDGWGAEKTNRDATRRPQVRRFLLTSFASEYGFEARHEVKLSKRKNTAVDLTST